MCKTAKNVDKNWKKWYIYEQKHGGVPCGHWYGDTEKTYNEAVMRIVALVALAPLIAIQCMGVVSARKAKVVKQTVQAIEDLIVDLE